ncbi:MAG: PHB depolymerase family esterase [Agarilytica sp.]
MSYLLRVKRSSIFIIGLLLALAGKTYADSCPVVSDQLYILSAEGLVEYYFDTSGTGYQTTGDNVVLSGDILISATVYRGDDGLGYSVDPNNCSGGTQGGWQTETLGGLSVHIYTPSGEATVEPHVADKRPLMLGLHGCFQSNDLMRDKGNWEATAEAYNMVVALADSGTIAYGNCWDSFGTGHAADNRDSVRVIELTETLRDREALSIDPNQVYITGLSSGGMQTMLVGCMRPDLYAGMGLGSNPTIGSNSGDWGSEAPESVTTEGVAMCRDLAESTGNSESFSSQITSIVWGDDDVVKGGMDEPSNGIHLSFFERNREVMSDIYFANTVTDTTPLEHHEGTDHSVALIYSLILPMPNPETEIPRISFLEIDGLGHNWSSGNGAQDTDINGSYVDYPAYVTSFFHENNRRIDRNLNTPPEITIIGETYIEISVGTEYVDQGATAYDEEEGDLSASIQTSGANIDTSEPGTHLVGYSVRDSGSLEDFEARTVVVVERENTPPEITLLGDNPLILQDIGQFEANDPGATAYDEEDGDISHLVYIDVVRRTDPVDQNPNRWQALYCVVDSGDAMMCVWRSIVIEVVVTPTPTVSPSPSPTVSPSPSPTVSPSPSPSPCTESTAMNFVHKVFGRAYSAGDFWQPNYFASGSDEALAGSTYDVSALYSLNGSTWHAGACPE